MPFSRAASIRRVMSGGGGRVSDSASPVARTNLSNPPGRPRPSSRAVGESTRSWYWYVLLAVVFAFLPLVFPDGRLPSRRWRIAVAVPAVGAVATGMLAAVAQTLHGQNVDYVIDNPIGIAGVASLEQNPAFVVIGPLFLIGSVAGVTALIVRFRRGTGVQAPSSNGFLRRLGCL